MRAGRNNSHGVKEHAFGLASFPNHFYYIPDSLFLQCKPKKKRAFDSSIVILKFFLLFLQIALV